MAANDAAYRRAVQTSAPGECWDILVLTAANEKQAQVYRQELALRQRSVGPTGSFFPAIQRSIVVPDPPGKRAGSGGATLGVLRAIWDQFGITLADLRSLRILLIHSGGASQRLPVYSPLGKIFSPLALLRPDRQICTLFDHLYVTLAGLPERLGPGMLVVAGDVLLVFDHRQASAPAPGVSALTLSVPAEMGERHGVFVVDAPGRIQRTLQKAPVAAMEQAGAVDEQGQALIDTGLLFFDVPSVEKLAKLSGCATGATKRGLHESFPGQIDLYDDVTAALAASTDRKKYLGDKKTTAMRRQLWKSLHGVPFQAIRLAGEFLHLGTTRQFRDAMVCEDVSPATRLFQQNILAYGRWAIGEGRRVYHSALLGEDGKAGQIGAGSVVEHSILGPGTSIGSGCMVSQTLAVRQPLKLSDERLFFQVPIRAAGGKRLFAQVLCGVADDFKGLYAQGACLFLNAPIERWLDRHGVSAQKLWSGVPAAQRSLWNARLFVATEDRDAAHTALWADLAARAPAGQIASWQRSPRYSMADLLALGDPQAMIEHREIVAASLQTGMLLESIRADEDRPVDTLVGHYSTQAAYEAALQQIEDLASKPAPQPTLALQQARAMWCAAQLLGRPDYPGGSAARSRGEKHMSEAFVKIAQASEMAMSLADRHERPAHITPARRIEATSPVRLDLAGGWSDTPPYCYERGGHVVNVAIDLSDHAPVRAIVRTVREPILVLESNDLAQHVELRSTSQARAKSDVHDPFALHKVAVDLVGILPAEGQDLARHLRKLGGGLIVSTECRVPKGSGLGTSSILAATLLGALHAAVGQHAAHEQLIEETLLLEQRMSTGGGWQDQVGGIVGGVKSTITAPGLPQQPKVEQLALSEEQLHEFENRLVVYYSGQQRLARDILRRAMGRWLAREPAVLRIMDELKQSAAALRAALLKSRWPAAAQEIARYWRLKKELYPGSTTPSIDVLFLSLAEHYMAAGLAGAGGGGFAYFLCRDARQAQRLRDALETQAGQLGTLGSVYSARINRQGLVVG